MVRPRRTGVSGEYGANKCDFAAVCVGELPADDIDNGCSDSLLVLSVSKSIVFERNPTGNLLMLHLQCLVFRQGDGRGYSSLSGV